MKRMVSNYNPHKYLIPKNEINNYSLEINLFLIIVVSMQSIRHKHILSLLCGLFNRL